MNVTTQRRGFLSRWVQPLSLAYVLVPPITVLALACRYLPDCGWACMLSAIVSVVWIFVSFGFWLGGIPMNVINNPRAQLRIWDSEDDRRYPYRTLVTLFPFYWRLEVKGLGWTGIPSAEQLKQVLDAERAKIRQEQLKEEARVDLVATNSPATKETDIEHVIGLLEAHLAKHPEDEAKYRALLNVAAVRKNT